MTQLIQRFLSVPVNEPESVEGVPYTPYSGRIADVCSALHQPGRDLIVAYILEPLIYLTAADWLRVCLEHERQRIEFQNLMLREKDPGFIQRLVVYVNCDPFTMMDERRHEAYKGATARATLPENLYAWHPGDLDAIQTMPVADGGLRHYSGSLKALFEDVAFKTEEVRMPAQPYTLLTIDLRQPFKMR